MVGFLKVVYQINYISQFCEILDGYNQKATWCFESLTMIVAKLVAELLSFRYGQFCHKIVVHSPLIYSW